MMARRRRSDNGSPGAYNDVPDARGSVKITSADPTVYPALRFNYPPRPTRAAAKVGRGHPRQILASLHLFHLKLRRRNLARPADVQSDAEIRPGRPDGETAYHRARGCMGTTQSVA